jgi:hypothetical protein
MVRGSALLSISFVVALAGCLSDPEFRIPDAGETGESVSTPPSSEEAADVATTPSTAKPEPPADTRDQGEALQGAPHKEEAAPPKDDGDRCEPGCAPNEQCCRRNGRARCKPAADGC